MYEIDLSTLMLIGIDDTSTKVVTMEKEFIIKESSKKIIDNSCKFFGSSLADRIKATNRLVSMASKTPIVIEDTRNIIFFPLRSTREKNNIWVSYNNLSKYTQNEDKTVFEFIDGKTVEIKFSYYIIDNQVTRSLILDYELNNRRKSLEK